MSAPQIPNLLSSRGGSHGRGRGRGRGRGTSNQSQPRPPASRKDLDIQATDTDAAVSRLSAVSLGYLDDPFALYFVNGPGTRRLPIINRGTFTRTTALDTLIHHFLSDHPNTKKQIISIGAGTDTRYFRLRREKKHKNLIYHEFDFPSVCRNKLRIVSSNEDLSKIDEHEELFIKYKKPPGDLDSDEEPQWGFLDTLVPETTYCCHSLDLRRLCDSPTTSLGSFNGLRPDLPTLIISECCLCYLEVDTARGVVKWFADQIFNLGIILYEPIAAHDSFGQMMVANLAARNIAMPTVKAYKTLKDQKQRLADVGFTGGQQAVTVERIWEQWVPAAEGQRVDKLEGLDEVEEWQMLARHYAVAWAWKGQTVDWDWGRWKALSHAND